MKKNILSVLLLALSLCLGVSCEKDDAKSDNGTPSPQHNVMTIGNNTYQMNPLIWYEGAYAFDADPVEEIFHFFGSAESAFMGHSASLVEAGDYEFDFGVNYHSSEYGTGFGVSCYNGEINTDFTSGTISLSLEGSLAVVRINGVLNDGNQMKLDIAVDTNNFHSK